MNKEIIKKQQEFMSKIKEINGIQNKKYIITTMGCQLNENDSEKLAGMLERMGYCQTEKLQEADIIIFNTCCVRENAEDKLFGKLGECKKVKEERGSIIAICGCMMQEEHMVKKIKSSYSFVDIIFGTHTLHKLPEDMYKILITNKRVLDVTNIDGEVYEGLPIKRNDNKKASVTIMYGCNNFCAYCIVPYVRGRERSRQPEDIISEIKNLAKEGYKEITLLGQNVNSYMKSEMLKGECENIRINTFAKLLEEVEKIDGIDIIRFVSPHPKDFTDDVIETIAKSKKISRIIHLPLQSGSTEILKLMNRKYTKEQYIDLANKIKQRISGITFSTDVIVGFPGETEQDFEETLDVVKQVEFDQVYMFIYSKRNGTPAAEKENQVPEETKHKRFDRLKALVTSQVQVNNQKYIGKEEEILIEGKSKNSDKFLTGRTSTNKVVILEGNDELIGKLVKVKIVSEHIWYLKGEIIWQN